MECLSEQKSICEKYGSPYFETPLQFKVGISSNIRDGIYPINGLRHLPEGDTTGWYIWAGEYSDDPDFFIPLHVEHLNEWCPEVIKYLNLAPGWRFLIAPGHEDVWNDITLIN